MAKNYVDKVDLSLNEQKESVNLMGRNAFAR